MGPAGPSLRASGAHQVALPWGRAWERELREAPSVPNHAIYQ